MGDGTAAPHYTVKIDGKEPDALDEDFQSFIVERDMFQPDMAALVLSNQGGKYSVTKIGQSIDVNVGDEEGTPVYKGEVVGLEPVYRGGEKSKLVIRCMNRFHRLLRHRKSVTYTDKTDQQILNQVVGDAGLSLEWKHEKSITYKHVYQHNQTDMEFLRTRAARMGCHVWCVGSTVYVKQPDLQQDPVVKLNVNESMPAEATIRSFTPRLSSASILNKVTVKGWNPETKELIVGDAQVQDSRLGSQTSVAGSGSLGNQETFTVDHPIWSREEAMALAKARLVDISLGFITGECELTGTSAIDLGQVVEIVANDEDDTKSNDPFNGNYYVMGLTHRFSKSRTRDGGWVTILRLARDASKQRT